MSKKERVTQKKTEKKKNERERVCVFVCETERGSE